MIRLPVGALWSEPLLVALTTLLEISCHCSFSNCFLPGSCFQKPECLNYISIHTKHFLWLLDLDNRFLLKELKKKILVRKVVNQYSKTCLKRPLKNRQNKDLNDR